MFITQIFHFWQTFTALIDEHFIFFQRLLQYESVVLCNKYGTKLLRKSPLYKRVAIHCASLTSLFLPGICLIKKGLTRIKSNPISSRMFHTGIQYIPVLSIAITSIPSDFKSSPIIRMEDVSVVNSFTGPCFWPLYVAQKMLSLCTSSPHALFIKCAILDYCANLTDCASSTYSAWAPDWIFIRLCVNQTVCNVYLPYYWSVRIFLDGLSLCVI